MKKSTFIRGVSFVCWPCFGYDKGQCPWSWCDLWGLQVHLDNETVLSLMHRREAFWDSDNMRTRPCQELRYRTCKPRCTNLVWICCPLAVMDSWLKLPLSLSLKMAFVRYLSCQHGGSEWGVCIFILEHFEMYRNKDGGPQYWGGRKGIGKVEK